MNGYSFEVRLRVQGPVISRAVQAGRAGVDAVALRDHHRLEALPGTLIRGLLRQAWTELGWDDAVHTWLGGDPMTARDLDKTGAAYRLPRSPLRLSDYWTVENRGEAGSYRHRIRIEASGAVTGGGLMIIETPFAPGAEVAFVGTVTALTADAEAVADLRRCIRKGLEWVPAVGGLKGVGFGRLLGVAVGEAEPLQPGAPVLRLSPVPRSDGPVTLALGLDIVCDDELCFPRSGSKGPGGNRYVTEDQIPGAALKAVLARLWPRGEPLRDRYFDALRITQALPVGPGADARPLAVPLSLAFPEGRTPADIDLRDLALEPGPRLLSGQAPRLAPDWKDAHRRIARRYCGWGDPPEHRVRVRNAIDPATGTVRTGYLFALETLVPDRHRWYANLQVPAVAPADLEPLIATLTGLLAQTLAPLGKTKAAARVTRIGPPWPVHLAGRTLVSQDGTVVIDIQTPALLLAPEFVCAPSNDGAALHRAYADAWATLSGGSLRLRHFFARQALGGGLYWWKGFRLEQGRYRPAILTQPGSVFVLNLTGEAQRAQAEAHLTRWRDQGLPQPAGFEDDWRRNPWLAQNGYGEVAINPGLHWQLAPRPEDHHG